MRRSISTPSARQVSMLSLSSPLPKKGDACVPPTHTKCGMKTTIPGAGVILFRFRDGEPEYLLLKGRDTGVWSFPKGHPELEDKGEALITATRETCEETGYIYDEDYHIYGNSIRFGKRPYWVGYLTTKRDVQLTYREHQRYGWFTREEACLLTANLDVRGWLRRSSVAFQEIIAHWLLQMPVPLSPSLPERPETHLIDEDNIVSLT